MDFICIHFQDRHLTFDSSSTHTVDIHVFVVLYVSSIQRFFPKFLCVFLVHKYANQLLLCNATFLSVQHVLLCRCIVLVQGCASVCLYVTCIVAMLYVTHAVICITVRCTDFFMCHKCPVCLELSFYSIAYVGK